VSNLGRIHHIAYVVDDIPAAAQKLNEHFGAGPFFAIDVVPVEEVKSRGEDAEFVHASAFGISNGVPVELMVIEKMAPQRAVDGFAGDTFPRLHHIAYAVPAEEVEATRAELEASGLPEYLSAKFGEDVSFSYHDGSASLGHDIELHADSEGLRGFFAMFEEAADGWDGSGDLVRPAFG
jgi:catechol 2,3-dioxygenase-like lactoylglutathione lyase family enzyme